MTFTTRMDNIPWFVHTSEPSWVWKPPRRACHSSRPVNKRIGTLTTKGLEWKRVPPWQRPERERRK